jgi:hypothetical protein
VGGFHLRKENAILVSGFLAILGGLFILASGVRLQSLMILAVNYVYQREGSALPPDVQAGAQIFIIILVVIVALGGTLAILGGLTIFGGHVTLAKFLMALGGGIGFAGIAFSIGYNIYAYGLSVLFTRIDYWIGILLATIGRYVAKDAS